MSVASTNQVFLILCYYLLRIASKFRCPFCYPIHIYVYNLLFHVRPSPSCYVILILSIENWLMDLIDEHAYVTITDNHTNFFVWSVVRIYFDDSIRKLALILLACGVCLVFLYVIYVFFGTTFFVRLDVHAASSSPSHCLSLLPLIMLSFFVSS